MYRTRIRVAALALAALLLTACTERREAQSAPAPQAVAAARLSGPYTHANLTIWLVHGPDKLKNAHYLTLQEGLDRKLVVVHETGNVNELSVENQSGEFEIFIQAGDIVRGGKQDRCIGVDIILPANSGKVPIQSFCVEQGRWQARGAERPDRFATSDKRVSGRLLKLEVQRDADQAGVWQEVGQSQVALGATVGGEVRAQESRSSYQLTLENDKVQAGVKEYLDALSKITSGQKDTLGFVFAINGELNNADTYGVHELFVKLWPKLLESAAVEALASKNSTTAFDTPSLAAVDDFLHAGSDRPTHSRRVSDRVQYTQQENDAVARFQALDGAQPATVHENVVQQPQRK